MKAPTRARDRGPSDVEAALAAMDAGDLRETVRDMLDELDERARGRVVYALIHRAARHGSGFVPAAVSEDDVAEVVAFVGAAVRVGHAQPSEVDEFLRRGSSAFLRKDYDAAARIFGALLCAIGEGEIDLGQHEMVDEVLGVDCAECAAQYVVSTYMTGAPEKRADAVRAAIDGAGGLGHFWEPLREMERVAVEPLPGLDDFLPRWRTLVQEEARGDRPSDWDSDVDRWRREVVQRLQGTDGLGELARSTKRGNDLRAWCNSLVQAGDWTAALCAFDEAAHLVADTQHERGEFLDGAALAARELERPDLQARLERAWRAAPDMLRLRRWLGSADGGIGLRERAEAALEACPERAHRQRAFLHVLLGDFEPAAELLRAAPGLGWSDAEHPGHLLFALFEPLLRGKDRVPPRRGSLPGHGGMNTEELEVSSAGEGGRRIAAPEPGQLLEHAGIESVRDEAARRAVVAAMRTAAERRLTGVTGQKRRRHYGHAAQLVAACCACDGSPEGGSWVASIRTEYRRFPALRAELDRASRS